MSADAQIKFTIKRRTLDRAGSILAEKTERRAIQIIARSFKVLETMPPNVRLSKIDDFELSLAKNMLKSIIENNNG